MSKGEAKPMKKNRRQAAAPQPKWVYLQIMNYVVLAVFVSSVTFAISSQRYMNMVDVELTKSELLPYAIVWSACLAYFFGFFGISFLDTDAMHESTSTDALSAIDDENISRKPLQVIKKIEFKLKGIILSKI